jgi:hypothetical protein
MFYAGSGSEPSHPGFYIKCGMQIYFFLAFYAFRSKILVLFMSKRSGIWKKFQSQGVKSTGYRIGAQNTFN